MGKYGLGIALAKKPGIPPGIPVVPLVRGTPRSLWVTADLAETYLRVATLLPGVVLVISWRSREQMWPLGGPSEGQEGFSLFSLSQGASSRDRQFPVRNAPEDREMTSWSRSGRFHAQEESKCGH